MSPEQALPKATESDEQSVGVPLGTRSPRRDETRAHWMTSAEWSVPDARLAQRPWRSRYANGCFDGVHDVRI